ncbi:MAG TPA: hypothetical protein PLZ67_06755 [Bacteroidales bacterium]|nr:hypothetical protein [Bacteroidales bacterium]
MKQFSYLFIILLVCLPLISWSQSARFEGLTSYQINLDSNSAIVAADKIINIHSKTTGKLSIQLFLCENKYEGGSLKGIPCGEVKVSNGLKKGEKVMDFSADISFTRPLRGSFYPVVLLLENVKGENLIIDYVTFDMFTINKKSVGILIGKND